MTYKRAIDVYNGMDGKDDRTVLRELKEIYGSVEMAEMVFCTILAEVIEDCRRIASGNKTV